MAAEQVLQDFGLTEAEVGLYVSLLKFQEATASQLARKTNSNRTFTYDRLKKLADSGLVSSVVKDNRRYFRAADPSQFFELLKEKEAQLQSILPELESYNRDTSTSPKTTVYTSKKGIKTILNLMLRDRKVIYVHGTIVRFKESMGEAFLIWNSRRVKAHIKMRILTAEDVKIDKAEIETLPEEEQTSITTFTFGEKTAIMFWADVPVAILIESSEIASNTVSFFNTIWNREIKIYEGVDGIIKAFYELIQNKNGYYLGVGYSWALAQVYGTKISDRWHMERIRNNVNARLISYDDADSVKYFGTRSRKWKLFNIKFLDKAVCGPACATVSDNLMATFIYTEGRFKVIVNKNRETIRAYKKHFEILWKMAHS